MAPMDLPAYEYAPIWLFELTMYTHNPASCCITEIEPPNTIVGTAAQDNYTENFAVN